MGHNNGHCTGNLTPTPPPSVFVTGLIPSYLYSSFSSCARDSVGAKSSLIFIKRFLTKLSVGHRMTSATLEFQQRNFAE